MMIVVQGRVKITTRATNGKERILDLVGPGESFGEMSLLDGEPRCADAKAVELTTAVVLGRKVFEELLESDRAFARHIIADLCARVRKTTALVEDTLFLSAKARLARRMRAMAKPNGVPVDGQAQWTIDGLSQQELADAVGMTRENVNRLLRAWRAAGIVTLRQRAILVHDLVELQRIACDGVAPD